MRARVDFVSNSSSCSFVVACRKDFLKAIAKDLARACVNRKDAYHVKDLGKKNQCILDFCLKTFQLAFLGELLINTKKETYSLNYFKKLFSKSRIMSEESAKKEWERYKSDLKQIKDGKESAAWIRKSYELDEYDSATDTAVHYEKVYVKDVVVSNDIMETILNRYHFATGNGPAPAEPEDIVKSRVDALLDLAKEKLKQDQGKANSFCGSIDVYQITKDTVDNTRNLISQGHRVDLDEWEDLDELEARLDGGDAIFYVRIAHSGDGLGDFYIYCDDGADGLDGVSGVEILTSDSL